MQLDCDVVFFRVERINKALHIDRLAPAECRRVKHGLFSVAELRILREDAAPECVVPVACCCAFYIVYARESVLHHLAAVGFERLAEVLSSDVARAYHVIISVMHLHQAGNLFGRTAFLADRLPSELLDSSESMPHLDNLSALSMRDHACRDAVCVEYDNIRRKDRSLLPEHMPGIAKGFQRFVLGQELAQHRDFYPALQKLRLKHGDIERLFIALAAYYCYLLFLCFHNT